MELISVVVICYNAEATIIETLESVKKQTYSNLELVVSDDCSKDNTVDIVREWLEKNKSRFSNTKLLESKKNKGVVANCNRAIRVASGIYIQLVAGDDKLVPQAVEEKYYFAKEKQLPIVLSKVKNFGKNSVKVHVMRQYFANVYSILQMDKKERLHKNLMRNYIPAAICNFYEKCFWEHMGGFDTSFPMVEDWPFAIKLLQKDIPLVLLNKELYEYRVSSTSVSGATENPKLLADCKKLVFRKNIRLLVHNGWIRDAILIFREYFNKE